VAIKTRPKRQSNNEVDPTGIEAIDRLPGLAVCQIDDYVKAVSAYVRESSRLAVGPKKAAQIRLSTALARALEADLRKSLPNIDVHVGEKKVSGALRTVNADVSQFHDLDGLRLAVELKPVNLAVGRAIWNRFGDLRTFAVNLHLKFPFAVVGGVLVVPTYEETGTRESVDAEAIEEVSELVDDSPEATQLVIAGLAPSSDTVATGPKDSFLPAGTKSTRHLIERAVQRLVRAGGRKTEGDAPHLLEAISVVVYDPTTSMVDPSLPPVGSGLRWTEFVTALVAAYNGRFED
jgi:hypothetical protein